MLMRTSVATADEIQPAFPSAWRMFVIGIPFWLCIVASSALSAALKGWQWEVQHAPVDLAIIIGGAAIGTGIYAFLRRLTPLAFDRQIAAVFALIVVIAIPTESLMRGVKLVNPLSQPRPAYEKIEEIPSPHGIKRVKVIRVPAETLTAATLFKPGELVRGGMFWCAIFSLWAAACLALLRDREARHRERRMCVLQGEAHDAQVRALRYQVNPHFLYNTLSSISTLILEGQSQIAERMTMRLSSFFRASLAQDPFQDVRLADELELQRLYLEIEQMRFSDSLEVRYDIGQGLESALVPSLILQPLVENSIKHGLQEAGALTILTISARASSDRLVLEVADNGRGPSDKHGTGVGLGNVRRRLAARFGVNCRFAAGPGERGGYQVKLELPLQRAA